MSMAESPVSALPDPTRRRTVRRTAAAISVLALGAAVAVVSGVFDGGAPSEAPRADAEAIPVEATAAARSTLSMRVTYPGELLAEVAELSAQASGRLEQVRVDIGDRVKQGDLLARIDASQTQRQLASAQADLLAAEAGQRRARAELDAAEVEVERGERLLAEQLIAAQEVDAFRARVQVLEAGVGSADAQRARARAQVGLLREQLRDTRVVAPFDGAVAERHLDRGALVQPGTTILRLVQAGPLRVAFRAPERDLGRIAPGVSLEVSTQATGEQRFSGKVTRVSAEVTRSDRAAAVHGVLDQDVEQLRPGMYASVELTFERLEDVVVVPGAALVEQPSTEGAARSGVFVVVNDHARFTPLTTLGRSGDHTAVEGVSPGAQVVTLGQEGLRDGARVRIVGERP